MREVNPRIYIFATTELAVGYQDYLTDIGIPEWDTDSDSAGDTLVEAAGRLCYRSWIPWDESRPLASNRNVGKVREGNKSYILNLLKQGHGSVLEHVYVSVLFRDVSRVFTHELVRHRAGMAYCLAGDVEVWSGSKQKGRYDGVKKKWTMRHLYEMSLNHHGRSRLKLIKVRCFDGDRFVPAKLLSVKVSGAKPIFRIDLRDGRSIRCSADHTFLSRDGWAPCRDLQPGVSLATNGRTHVPEEERRQIAERMTGEGNHQWKGDEASAQAGRMRAWKMYRDIPPCEDCAATENVQRHHIDRNTLNNERSNIEFLCQSCHTKRHVNDVYGRILTAGWSEIESIREDGYEMTYDLEVDHPAHNFVANGIVTHNSQESLRFVRAGSLGIWIPASVRALGAAVVENFVGAVETIERLGAEFSDLVYIDAETDFSRKKVKTSLIRRLFPQGMATSILATGNLRAWRHIINMRCDESAEEEMHITIGPLARTLKDMYPACFQDMDLNEHGRWEFRINRKV